MADAGSIYAEAGAHIGEHLGHTINAILADSQKKQQQSQLMQGYLDVARRLQVPDAASGKPKSVFDQKSLDIIQDMLAHHNTAGAAAQEAALGIGKGMQDRYQTAAAKQQAAIDKQNRLQQLIQQGPITAKGPLGQPYIANPNTGTFSTDTAKPQNVMGMTAEEQLNLQKGISKDANAAQTAQFKAQEQSKLAQSKVFNAFLKSNGIASPTDLFDPSIQRAGTVDPTSGAFVNDPNQNPTHVQFYHEDPEMDDKGNVKLNNRGEPIGGKAGVVLPTSSVIDLQNAAASMAGPQSVQALQWLRQNPSSEHAAAVSAEIARRMGEVDQAPQPQPFNPSPPSFAPGQAPAAANQQGTQPIAGSASDPLPDTPPPQDDTGD